METNVYLVVLEDRHSGIEVEVFASKDAALERAQEIVDEYDFEDNEEPVINAGWMIQARLSNEGDHVHVEEAEVQP